MLRRLRGMEDVVHEVNAIQAAVANEAAIGEASWRELWCDEALRRRVFIGVCIMLSQQLTGINAIMYYAPIILSNLSVSTLATTAGLGVINFFSTFIAIRAVDHAGRKSLLFYGGLGCALSMLLCALFVGVGGEGSGLGYLVAFFMGTFVCCFAWR